MVFNIGDHVLVLLQNDLDLHDSYLGKVTGIVTSRRKKEFQVEYHEKDGTLKKVNEIPIWRLSELSFQNLKKAWARSKPTLKRKTDIIANLLRIKVESLKKQLRKKPRAEKKDSEPPKKRRKVSLLQIFSAPTKTKKASKPIQLKKSNVLDQEKSGSGSELKKSNVLDQGKSGSGSELGKSRAKEDEPESEPSLKKGDFVFYGPSQVYGVISDVQWKTNRIRMLTVDGKPAPELGDKKEMFEQTEMEKYLGDDCVVTKQRYRLKKSQCRDAQEKLMVLEEDRESKRKSLKDLREKEIEIMKKYKEVKKEMRMESNFIHRTEDIIRSQRIRLGALKEGQTRAWNNFQSAADRRKNNIEKIERIKKEAMI